MDWSTRLFGLDDAFLYSGGGGGIIMVSNFRTRYDGSVRVLDARSSKLLRLVSRPDETVLILFS